MLIVRMILPALRCHGRRNAPALDGSNDLVGDVLMDSRGRWMDNVFVERLWRSLKHEDICLKGYADGREAKAGIPSWMTFYNARRPHQALGDHTPMAVWQEGVRDALGAKAVDLMDNAHALTTCPQQKQQTQPLAA